MAKNITLYNNDGTVALYPKAQPCGMDASRVLATYNGTFSYTASEDCFVYVRSCCPYYFTINGVRCYTGGASSVSQCLSFILLKGQTCEQGQQTANVNIYGLKH